MHVREASTVRVRLPRANKQTMSTPYGDEDEGDNAIEALEARNEVRKEDGAKTCD